MFELRIHAAIFSVLILLAGCFQPGEVRYSQLYAQAYYKDEVRDGVTYSIRLRHKPFIFLYQSHPYTGKVFDYFDGGEQKLKCVGRMKDGFPDGNWKYFYENGRLQMTGNFIVGNADSIWNKYYEDGSRKVVERYTIRNDTVYCDTLGAWYRDGTALTEQHGDTALNYYGSGRLKRRAIGKPVTEEEIYMKNGVLVSRLYDCKREYYSPTGSVVRKIYFIQTGRGREKFTAEKYTWSPEQKSEIAKADSVEFDLRNPYDPVIKIYQGQ